MRVTPTEVFVKPASDAADLHPYYVRALLEALKAVSRHCVRDSQIIFDCLNRRGNMQQLVQQVQQKLRELRVAGLEHVILECFDLLHKETFGKQNTSEGRIRMERRIGEERRVVRSRG